MSKISFAVLDHGEGEEMQDRELNWIAEPEHFVILQNAELITY